MRSSFFTAGGTLSASAISYIPRKADEDLYTALMGGRYAFLLNARQMGKSSLSVRTMSRLREAGRTCVMCDLTRVGGKSLTADQWYASLAREIAASSGLGLSLTAYFGGIQESGIMQRFFDFLQKELIAKAPGDIVLFLDEIDSTQNLSFSTDEFFAGIRELFNRRSTEPELHRLTFCLVGVALPSDLISDPRVTPFNIGERIYLQDFTLEEMSAYAEQLGPHGNKIIQRLHYWTNGHPYLTQNLCLKLVSEPTITDANAVDRLVHEHLLAPAARDSNTNLVDVARRVLNAGEGQADPSLLRSELLTIYGRVRKGQEALDDESNYACGILKLSGIVGVRNGRLTSRNRIYDYAFDQKWITSNLPAQEVRRQKKAYQKGLFTAGSLGFAVFSVIALLAVIAVMQARRADESARRAIKAQESEKAARLEAERFSFQAYALAFNQTAQNFDKGQVDVAMRSFLEFESQPNRGWEYDFLANRVHRFGRSFRASRGRVTDLAYDKDGRLLTLSDDSALRIWEPNAKDAVHQVKVYQGSRKLEIAKDGASVFLASDTGRVSRINLSDGKMIWDTKTTASPTYTFSHDRVGDILYLGQFSKKGQIVGVSSVSGEIVRRLTLPTYVIEQVEPSQDGRKLAVATVRFLNGKEEFTIHLLDATTSRVMWMTKGLRARSFRFSADDQTLTVGLTSGEFGALSTSTGKTLRLTPTGDQDILYAGKASLSDRYLVVGARKISIYNSDQKTLLFQIALENRLLGYSLTGKSLSVSGSDGIVSKWNLDSLLKSSSIRQDLWMEKVDEIKPTPATSINPVISPDGEAIIYGDSGARGERPGNIYLRKSDKQIGFTFSGDPVRFSRKVPSFAAVNSEALGERQGLGMVRILDTNTGSVLKSFPGSFALEFSPDGRKIAIGGGLKGELEPRVRIYDLQSEKLVFDEKFGDQLINIGGWSPDGRLLVVGGEQHTLSVIDIESKKVVSKLPGASTSAYYILVARDQRHVICSTGRELRVWKLGQEEPLLSAATRSEQPYASIIELPGERVMVTWADYSSVYHIPTGQHLLSFPNQNLRHPQLMKDGSLLGVTTRGEVMRLPIESRK